MNHKNGSQSMNSSCKSTLTKSRNTSTRTKNGLRYSGSSWSRSTDLKNKLHTWAKGMLNLSNSMLRDKLNNVDWNDKGFSNFESNNLSMIDSDFSLLYGHFSPHF